MIFLKTIIVIEQATEDIYENARKLERIFLNSRLEILQKEPEQLIKEVLLDIKTITKGFLFMFLQ